MFFNKWKKKAEELEVENVALRMRIALMSKPNRLEHERVEVVPIGAHVLFGYDEPESVARARCLRILGESLEPAVKFTINDRPCSNLKEMDARAEIVVRRGHKCNTSY